MKDNPQINAEVLRLFRSTSPEIQQALEALLPARGTGHNAREQL